MFNEIAKIKLGWHFGEGFPLTKKTIELARKVVEIGMGMILEPNIFPTIEGGIVIVFYGGNGYSAEIEINSQQNLSVSYQKGFGFDYDEIQQIEKASTEDIIEVCREISALDPSNSRRKNDERKRDRVYRLSN